MSINTMLERHRSMRPADGLAGTKLNIQHRLSSRTLLA
jgi:hypothetical protein